MKTPAITAAPLNKGNAARRATEPQPRPASAQGRAANGLRARCD